MAHLWTSAPCTSTHSVLLMFQWLQLVYLRSLSRLFSVVRDCLSPSMPPKLNHIFLSPKLQSYKNEQFHHWGSTMPLKICYSIILVLACLKSIRTCLSSSFSPLNHSSFSALKNPKIFTKCQRKRITLTNPVKQNQGKQLLQNIIHTHHGFIGWQARCCNSSPASKARFYVYLSNISNVRFDWI